MTLFGPPPSEPEQFVDVALHLPLDREFQYRVPETMRGRLQLGSRVRVPFRNRRVIGFCVGFGDAPRVGRLREVAGVVDDAPLLSDVLLCVARFVARRYACPLGEALAAVLPPAVRRETRARSTVFVRSALSGERLLAEAAAAERPAQAAILRELAARGGGGPLAELRSRVGCSDSPFRTLERKGLLEIERRRASGISLETGEPPGASPFTPTPEQARTLAAIEDSIERDAGEVFLLFGVTGSGKTEVYLRAIERVVRRGRQAIVLVPEISLTPQTVARFRSRFARVAVLHSHLTDAERREHWLAIQRGDAEVVIGARSAIFAPTPRLGLVVIDEEHESSFKQQSAPRYHARDTAVERARIEGASVILGSATPSLESYHRAVTSEYRMLRLPRRIHERPLPRVEVVDRTQEPGPPGRGLLGRRLCVALENALRRREQVILFLNRRGHSTYLCCTRCGHVVRCERCAISLTYHRTRRRALCHYCGYDREAPVRCPACAGNTLRYLGAGTEKIEDEVRDRFPKARVARVDSDTARRKGYLESTLGEFRLGRIDILVGTQMIAKGLDFPDVTVVGIVAADATLHLPDFRAAERTFQLVTQVAGRTGRSSKGGVVVAQTYDPGSSAIRHASQHDFEGFAAGELSHRRAAGYPPFRRLARILVSGRSEDEVARAAHGLRETIAGTLPPGDLLGPCPAPIPYLEERFRFHLLLRAETHEPIERALRHARAFPPARRVGVVFDVDPTDTL